MIARTYLNAHHGEAEDRRSSCYLFPPRSPAQPQAAERCLGRARNAVEHRPASLLLDRSMSRWLRGKSQVICRARLGGAMCGG
jgi:hypothetical protein